jgi:hypothetical protein
LLTLAVSCQAGFADKGPSAAHFPVDAGWKTAIGNCSCNWLSFRGWRRSSSTGSDLFG